MYIHIAILYKDQDNLIKLTNYEKQKRVNDENQPHVMKMLA
jgi:hypothetical protein